jgi:hypothetical protein
MAEYTYRFANLLSDSDIAELELTNVRFDRRIIQPGSFSATIPVTNLDVAGQVKKIVPARTVVHVYRDADIWGTYIIWRMSMRSSSRGPVSVELSGATLESWFYKRIIDQDLSFDDVDQFDIARALVDTAQTGWFPYTGNANLQIGYQENLSGVLRDRSYFLADASSVGQRLEELANVDNGFEYVINTYDDSDNDIRAREIVFSNRMSSENDPVVFTYPGSILSYDVTYDATDAATAFWARGDTIEEDLSATSRPLMMTSPVLATQWLDNAFPHMDKVVNYSTVIELDTLIAYADWWAQNHAGVIAVPVFEINTTDTPTIIRPTALGTDAIITVIDEMFGMGDIGPEFAYQNRIIGIEVSPPQRGKSESIRLVIEQNIDPTDIGEV